MSTDNPHEFTDEQLGLEFPCAFAIKAMGRDHDNFLELVLGIIRMHADVDDTLIQQRPSSSGKYLSVTVSVQAESKAHLDRIYTALNDHERVLMTL